MEQECGRCRVVKDVGEFSPSYRGQRGTWCRACFADYVRARKHGNTPQPAAATGIMRVCGQCGIEYQAKQNRPSQYCTRVCKSEARKLKLIAENNASKPERSCLWCGGSIPNTMRSDARFCSRDCMGGGHRQVVNIRRRSGAKDPTAVTLISIAQRDKFRCGICDQPVDMALKNPDPQCASLDHVVPLANGGTHDPANLRLTHLRCNIVKGTK